MALMTEQELLEQLGVDAAGSLMTEQELDKIWGELSADTTNRSKGSFKRLAVVQRQYAPRKVLVFGAGSVPEVGPIIGKVGDPAAGAVKTIYSALNPNCWIGFHNATQSVELRA